MFIVFAELLLNWKRNSMGDECSWWPAANVSNGNSQKFGQ